MRPEPFKTFFCMVCNKKTEHVMEAVVENISMVRYRCKKCGKQFKYDEIVLPKKEKAEHSLTEFLK